MSHGTVVGVVEVVAIDGKTLRLVHGGGIGRVLSQRRRERGERPRQVAHLGLEDTGEATQQRRATSSRLLVLDLKTTGVDEDTAAFIKPGDNLEVVGSGGITIIDPTKLSYSSMDRAKRGEPVSDPDRIITMRVAADAS